MGVEEPWFAAFVNFCGVNTPTTADFKLPTWCHWKQVGERCHNQLLRAGTNCLQHTIGISEKSKSLGWNNLLPHKGKTPRFVRKILAAHSLTHWTLKSPVPMSMGPRENQSFQKSLSSSTLYLWWLQAGALKGTINIPYFNALGNQAFLSQQQWDPVSKVMHELRTPSLPMLVEVLAFSCGQSSQVS